MGRVIGIDPDAAGFVCALVDEQVKEIGAKRFGVGSDGLAGFIRWHRSQGECIVALEGIHGQSLPIERALREAGVVFYSFKPSATDKFRKAVLGQNKNNERDAESVARFALALQRQGKLDRFRRVFEPDAELQLVSRRHESVGKELTAEGNRLWKLLRQASPDLYLSLGGKSNGADDAPAALRNEGILCLLASKPQIGGWQELSEDELMAAMGGGEYKGRRAFVAGLQKLVGLLPRISQATAFVISSSAQQLRQFRWEQTQIKRMLVQICQELPGARALTQIAGIGSVTATTMLAEIIDIRRFPSEDHLAGYAGLGRVEHSTGERTRMVAPRMYNRRLKDAFMTAAMNVVRYDPNCHLAGYHRNLVKKGMKSTEATKRVARALVRLIYRTLTAVLELDQQTQPAAGPQQGQGGVASDQGRGDKWHLSNTPPPSPNSSRRIAGAKVKSVSPRTGSRTITRRTRQKLKRTG
jgi:transposase